MIGIVIPYYKAPEDLARCKECLGWQNLEMEVYVHDNSIDNRYFTAGVNIGIKYFLKLDMEYICLMNQDVFLEDSALKKMLRLMDSSPDIGIVTACMLPSGDTDVCIDTGGLWVLPSGGSQTMSRYEIKDAPLLWATGACLLLRADMITEIGLLDENMVHFSSDVDYCFSARARGWEVWRCGTAIGIHKPQSLQLSKEMHLRRNKDTEYLLRKWTGGLFHKLNFTWQKEPLEQEIVVFKKGKKINVGP